MPEMPIATQQELRALVPFYAPRTAGCRRSAAEQRRDADQQVHRRDDRQGGYSLAPGFFSMTASSRRWRSLRARAAALVKATYAAAVGDHAAGSACRTAKPTVGRAPGPDARGDGGRRDRPSPPPGARRRQRAGRDVTRDDAHQVAGKAAAGAGRGSPRRPRRKCRPPTRIGFPVVMKILSPDILHKSEIGGVLLNVADAAAVRDGFATPPDCARRHRPPPVAKQLQGGVECILAFIAIRYSGPSRCSDWAASSSR